VLEQQYQLEKVLKRKQDRIIKKKLHKINLDKSVRSNTRYFWFTVVKLIALKKNE